MSRFWTSKKRKRLENARRLAVPIVYPAAMRVPGTFYLKDGNVYRCNTTKTIAIIGPMVDPPEEQPGTSSGSSATGSSGSMQAEAYSTEAEKEADSRAASCVP